MVSIESENDKILNPLSTEDEKPLKSAETKLEARIERRQAPSASLPDQPVQKPAPALPKQEVLAKPKNSELETGKNRTAVSDALIHFNSGVDLYHQRDYAKAIQAYQKVIEIDPGYAEAHNNLGIIYQEAGDYDSALSSYQKAIEINPKYEKALNNLGVLLYLKGRYEESIQAFQKALTFNANNIESYINLGILFKKQGQVDRAIDSFHRALSINPLHGEAHYNIGLLYEQLDEIEMAIGHYQKFVQMASKTHPDLVDQVKRHLSYLIKKQENKKE
jgi:type IV pilus biogenesis/stability protein PilW